MAKDLFGSLDVLCHVAGGSGRALGDGPLHECTLDGWRRTLELNLQSVFLTNRAAIRLWLRECRPGVVLNVASVLPLAPSPQHFDVTAYVAAKGAIITLSRQVAARYARDGIRCNVLAPGLVNTPMARRALEDDAARLHNEAAVRDGEREVQELLDEEYGEPAFEGRDDALDLVDDRGLDAFGRLVEEEQLRAADEGTGDSELLLLTAGEETGLAPRHLLEHRE